MSLTFANVDLDVVELLRNSTPSRGATRLHDVELLRNSTPSRGATWLHRALAMVLLLAVGCQPHRPERMAVSGVVSLDGKPLSKGTVYLLPSNDGMPSATAEVIDGKFSFSLDDGPVVGNYAVRVTPVYPEFEQFTENPRSLPSSQRPEIAPRFTEFGALTAIVSASGIEPREFILKSR